MQRTKGNTVRFKTGAAEGLGEGEFLVYPSTFTRTPDAYGDVVAKGAFARGIAERRPPGSSSPAFSATGSTTSTPMWHTRSTKARTTTAGGSRAHSTSTTPPRRRSTGSSRGGRIRELSFAYDVRDAASVTPADGVEANELRDLDVHEFSFVLVGANRDTSVASVKSARSGRPRLARVRARLALLDM